MSTIDTVGPGWATNATFPDAHGVKGRGSGETTGVFLGHAVKVSDSPASLLADAAEELGFSVDRTKDYELERRKERSGVDDAKRLLELCRLLMEKAGKSEKLNDLIEHLKHADDRRALERALEEAFPDPTDRWTAMRSALDAFESDPTVPEHLTAELRSLSERYYKENAVAIRLGIPPALASEHFPEAGSVDQARDFYRETVGEFSSVSEVYAEIRAKYGDRFEAALDFLFAAIGADIASETPSMGRTHLESVHAKLGLVRLAQSGWKICEDLLTRWSTVHGEKTSLDATALLGDLLALRERGRIAPGRIEAICEKARPSDIEHEVLFAQELLSAVRKFPPALFEDDAGRMSVLDAVQNHVDATIAREDEWLASLDEP